MKLNDEDRQNAPSVYSFKKLSVDHDPEILKENKRICRMGGETRPLTEKKKQPKAINLLNTDERHRVWIPEKDIPGCLISRSIGDEIGHQVGMTSEPDVSVIKIDRQKFSYFLTMGTEGLWKVMNEQILIKATQKLFN